MITMIHGQKGNPMYVKPNIGITTAPRQNTAAINFATPPRRIAQRNNSDRITIPKLNMVVHFRGEKVKVH